MERRLPRANALLRAHQGGDAPLFPNTVWSIELNVAALGTNEERAAGALLLGLIS